MEWGRTGLRGIVTLTSAVLILVFQMGERPDTAMWARSTFHGEAGDSAPALLREEA